MLVQMSALLNYIKNYFQNLRTILMLHQPVNSHILLCIVYSKFKAHCIQQAVWSMNALSKSEGHRVTGGR